MSTDTDAVGGGERSRRFVIEMVSGQAGPSLSVSVDGKNHGYRLAGPKPWGGGSVVRKWNFSERDLRDACRILGYRLLPDSAVPNQESGDHE